MREIEEGEPMFEAEVVVEGKAKKHSKDYL